MREKRLARSLILACLAAALFWPVPTEASVIEDLTIAELTARATAVVHGRVVSVESSWDETHRRIYTTVTIRAISYLAGQGPEIVTIRQVGGRVDDTELRVEGQPRFTVDERVVVFLEPVEESPELWIVVSMAAGKFNVTTDRVTGELVLSRELSGLTPVRLGPAGTGLVRRSNRVARPLLLREMIQEVQRVFRGGQP
jgi:hypothetical protein